MERAQIAFLYYITHVENLISILDRGLLSHNRIEKLRIKHIRIDDPDVQERRIDRKLPNGKSLHDHVNLYFNPRNAMMSKLRHLNESICVLVIDPKIMDIADVLVTDMNASAKSYVRFFAVKEIANLDAELIFSEDWLHPNPTEYYRRKSSDCAEVLIPNFVTSSFVLGIYV